MTNPPPPRLSSFLKVGDRQWSTITLVTLLMLLYVPLLVHWADGWFHKSISLEHEYFSHGLLGLPVAAYIAWEKRWKWCNLPDHIHLGGFVLMVLGVMAYLSGMADAINLAFPLTLTGLCLWLKDKQGLGLMWFPLMLVWLTTPTELPYLIAPYALPLQRFIAGVAGFILFQCGIDVHISQIYLYVNDRTVEVAPHCAGLKMLFTSTYVGLMLLYWFGKISHRRLSLGFLGSAIVISVTANIIRNTLLAFFHGTDQEAAFIWLHDGWGGDLYSALMLVSLIPVLRLIEYWFDKGDRAMVEHHSERSIAPDAQNGG